jgi:hypothetical protein
MASPSERACEACERAQERARVEGHRTPTEFVCFDHAAFYLDSPEGRALFPKSERGQQGELFA